MRLFVAVGLAAGGAVAATWIMLTQRLAELGVDMWMSRVGAVGIAFFSLATIGLEEVAGSTRARLQRGRARRLQEGSAEAGQVSVASQGGELSRPILGPARLEQTLRDPAGR